jgi:disulfide bond formation protein DsbB
MKRSVIFLLALWATGCTSSAPPPHPVTSATTPTPVALKPGDAGAGKVCFEQTCSACHGADGKGVKGLGKDLVTSTFVKGQSDADLLAFIRKGRDPSDPANTTKVAMPPKGGNPSITDQQLADIVAHIRKLQGG